VVVSTAPKSQAPTQTWQTGTGKTIAAAEADGDPLTIEAYADYLKGTMPDWEPAPNPPPSIDSIDGVVEDTDPIWGDILDHVEATAEPGETEEEFWARVDGTFEALAIEDPEFAEGLGYEASASAREEEEDFEAFKAWFYGL
jgi:hypothetical protein